jgi:hypothetical protein
MSAGDTTLGVPPGVLEYVQQHKTLTLATASPAGVPRASTFLYVSEGPSLYFWTRATTITARQIEQNPVVSFTIDDYTEDLSKTRGVQGTGECSVLLSGEEIVIPTIIDTAASPRPARIAPPYRQTAHPLAQPVDCISGSGDKASAVATIDQQHRRRRFRRSAKGVSEGLCRHDRKRVSCLLAQTDE